MQLLIKKNKFKLFSIIKILISIYIMGDDYSLLITRVNEIIRNKNCEITMIQDDDNTYTFIITKQDSSEEIAYVTISRKNHVVKIHNLREFVNKGTRRIFTTLRKGISKVLRRRKFINKIVDLFYIKTVYTKKNYEGNYFATLLLIYGISSLKLKYKHIKHATLNDCSDNSSDIERNLYHMLGFFPLGKVSLLCPPEDAGSETEPSQLVLDDIEKQADLILFPQRASDALTKIETKTVEKGAALIKKVRKQSQKHRRRRNIRTHRR